MDPQAALKILATHVPAGAGHQKAAEAVATSVKRLAPRAEVKILDALEGADADYRWTFTKGYLGVIQKLPWLWAAGYAVADWTPLHPFSHWFHRFSNWLHGRSLETIFSQENPQAIVGAHFFPMEVAGYLKSQGRLKSKLVTVITDFFPHAVWVNPGIDLYCVVSDQTKQALIRRGVDANKIRVTGIPIDPRFTLPLDRKKTALSLGLDPDLFTVLVCSGGHGIGSLNDVVRAIATVKEPLQILVVSGKNAHLLQELKAMKPPAPHRLVPYGFVNNMPELMSVSDLFVSKPGGLSCVEALAKGLPMILLKGIPGQEAYNAQWITKLGVAVQTHRLSDIPAWILKLKLDNRMREQMTAAARRHSKPDASERVAREVLA